MVCKLFQYLENGPRTGNLPWGNTYLNSLHTCMSKGLLLLAPLQYCTKDGRKYENEGKTSWTNVFREVSECELTIGKYLPNQLTLIRHIFQNVQKRI